jgi:hypothetical protein
MFTTRESTQQNGPAPNCDRIRPSASASSPKSLAQNSTHTTKRLSVLLRHEQPERREMSLLPSTEAPQSFGADPSGVSSGTPGSQLDRVLRYAIEMKTPHS